MLKCSYSSKLMFVIAFMTWLNITILVKVLKVEYLHQYHASIIKILFLYSLCF